ncbi:zygote arrest protein 1 isoform X2 [Conger conger]|uniref:zygote arrest protein 1 isoform X2 n=1 Tax=Conger conger TaxID=82655 RepID=UPI002A59FA62|nr:zygote arrest protein 1 isoform X2 [Conger conger]
MATYGDESIDSYLYSSYNPYSCRYLNPKPRAVGWRHKNYLADCGHAETYFDNHQRAQLKSILSQINPDLTPRLRKANTKDVGVQVNPKADASVQCSLGPRTLLARKREALRRRQENQPPGSPVGSTVRYPRTLGVYSPIASRRLFDFTDPDKEEDDPAPAPAAEPPEPGEKSEDAGGEKGVAEDKPGKTDAKVGLEKGVDAKEEQSSETEKNPKSEDGAKSKARVRFQFLEQKYGYYHCRDCNLRWESAYVWCVQGTNKVYFKQFCRTCQKAFNPYRVEDITCQACKRARCTCQVTLRHVDPKRPHRQDLCGRCKGKRLSCDSTFSFKYII